MKRILLAAILLAAALLSACSNQVQYGNAADVETVTTGFGSTDLQLIAEQMVNSLIASPVLAGDKRPVLYVAKVKNKTDEHVDTQNITDKIKVTLLKSGKVRFTATTEVGDEIEGQLAHQTGGQVRPDTAKRLGQEIGADMFLYGEITSIRKRAGRVEDVYFKFTLNLVNIQSGLVEWADEKEIRKGEKKALFGS
jgi:penicillin-binding protein activator